MTANNQHLQQPAHSMFISSFSSFSDSFRNAPSHSSNNLHTPMNTNLNFNNKTTQFYPQTLNSEIQRNFSTLTYQKPFGNMSNERMIDPYNVGIVNDNRNPNQVESNLMNQINDRHIQRNQYANQNMNFLPPWKQESNPWWADDKTKMMNSNPLPNTPLMDDQSHSYFHYR